MCQDLGQLVHRGWVGEEDDVEALLPAVQPKLPPGKQPPGQVGQEATPLVHVEDDGSPPPLHPTLEVPSPGSRCL